MGPIIMLGFTCLVLAFAPTKKAHERAENLEKFGREERPIIVKVRNPQGTEPKSEVVQKDEEIIEFLGDRRDINR